MTKTIKREITTEAMQNFWAEKSKELEALTKKYKGRTDIYGDMSEDIPDTNSVSAELATDVEILLEQYFGFDRFGFRDAFDASGGDFALMIDESVENLIDSHL
ncbi:hypothetical protein [Gimesia chilikensis]|uniref:Uncharacterized protein n=1 Tax=Gimesia chilikensis TaxID=2605989 RepID=A0A517PYI9_9PLAN|nr:hypothetical protein [Gimesia chilikensis]QDT24439.1 hypothetical protein HG66A1_62710 [Gimesia chilikensis]